MIKIFIEKTKYLFFHHTKLYESVKNEKIDESLNYFLIASLPLFVLVLISGFYNLLTGYMLGWYLSFFLFICYSTVWETCIIHILLTVFKIDSKIEQTFKLVIYREAFLSLFSASILSLSFYLIYILFPSYTIALIYLIFLALSFLYSLYILIRGFSILYQVGILKSILICLCASIGTFVIYIAIANFHCG